MKGNKRKYRGLVMAAAVSLALCQASLAQANLVQNGSFEDAYPGNNICGSFWYTVGYGVCDPAGTAIPGWRETGAGVDWHNNAHFPEPFAQDGRHSIDLIGNNAAGRIEQDVPTASGAVYTMTFYYARHGLCSFPGVSATATAGTTSLVVVPVATGTNPGDWNSATMPFTATGASTTIAFASNQSQGCGGVILDNVSVEQLLPQTADECKKGGWQAFGVFKNQGDCVSFVATDGRNLPAN